jgi:hypothetical protein
MTRTHTYRFAFAFAFLLIAACSGTGSVAEDPTDSSPPIDPTAPTSGCNVLANVASEIPITVVASDPPKMTGGTIVDGTYVLTDATAYAPHGGASSSSSRLQTTIVIAGNVVQVVSNGSPARRTVGFSLHGAEFTATDACPKSATSNGSFTAAGRTVSFALPWSDGGTIVQTFTRT